jgi:hypothetical protein
MHGLAGVVVGARHHETPSPDDAADVTDKGVHAPPSEGIRRAGWGDRYETQENGPELSHECKYEHSGKFQE